MDALAGRAATQTALDLVADRIIDPMTAARPGTPVATALSLAVGRGAWAILRQLAGERFEAYSAGLRPSGVRPETIAVLSEAGYDVSGLSSQPVDDPALVDGSEDERLVAFRAARDDMEARIEGWLDRPDDGTQDRD